MRNPHKLSAQQGDIVAVELSKEGHPPFLLCKVAENGIAQHNEVHFENWFSTFEPGDRILKVLVFQPVPATSYFTMPADAEPMAIFIEDIRKVGINLVTVTATRRTKYKIAGEDLDALMRRLNLLV